MNQAEILSKVWNEYRDLNDKISVAISERVTLWSLSEELDLTARRLVAGGEMYKCQSYFEGGKLRDCTCGYCF